MPPPKYDFGSNKPASKLPSVMVANFPPRPKQAGPGTAPTLSGPITIFPLTTLKIELPPAPALTISHSGNDTLMPSTCPRRTSATVPSRYWQMSVVVPPTSIETTSVNPYSFENALTPSMPPRGPEL